MALPGRPVLVVAGAARHPGEGEINYRQLRYFVKVVEIGSLTGAAEQLNVAQPALGLQIRNLEDDLGVPLLVRHSRGVHATPAGELLHRRALSLLQALEETRHEVIAAAGTARETIRFGITPSAMLLLGPDIILEAREIMPNVFLSLVEELSYILVSALEAGDLDAAFTYQGTERPILTRRALMEEDLLLISSPDADPSSEPITFAEAVRRDLVLAGERDIVRRAVEDTAARLSLPVNVVYETQSVPATRNLISKGIASGVMPYGSAADEIARGTLVGRRIVEPAVPRTLYLAERIRHAPFQHEAEFQAFLEKALARLTDRLGDLARPVGRI